MCEASFSPGASTASKAANPAFDEVKDIPTSPKPIPPAIPAAKNPPKPQIIEAELDDEIEDEEIDRPRKKVRTRDDYVDEDQPNTRKNRRTQDDDDDDDENEDYKPRRAGKKRGGKQGKSNVLMWALIGGGVLVLVLGAVVIGILVLGSSGDTVKTNPSDNSELNEFSGRWPLFDRTKITDETVILHIIGVVDNNTADAIGKQIDEIAPKGNTHRQSIMIQTRMAVALSPFKNIEEFAKRITFGRVVAIQGRVISIVANKL